MQFENPYLVDHIALYKIAKKWIHDNKFLITRCRTSECDNLPFEFMKDKWVYKITIPVKTGTETYYSLDIGMHEMTNIVESAMIWGCDFEMNRPVHVLPSPIPFFIEEAYSDPSEDEPDGAVGYWPHWHLMEDMMREECQFDADLDDYHINLMDAYLTVQHRRWLDSRGINYGSTPMEEFGGEFGDEPF